MTAPLGRLTGPIGVFDSGVGGLTVLNALRALLPTDDFVYLGDTARLPYGTKSPESVLRYSLQCAAALVARRIRCLVVACNTASASALTALRERYPDIAVFGVIEPGAAAAVAVSRTRHVVVIGTEGTIGGGAYQRAIHAMDARVTVTGVACSLFVALAEEGWTDDGIARDVARRYLEPAFAASGTQASGAPQAAPADTPPPDTLVLGCTHFPVLADAIRAVLPASVRIVDSAASVATVVSAALAGSSPLTGRGSVRWLATDGATRFARVGGIFLGEPLSPSAIEVVDL